ncbi:hypothetical protein [Granulicella sp. S190]|uniref:hypothetical protein n=1 Tax=Granulicella sp. S190 TaxID=1747226 RepID=UPI00131C8C3D|nr:hypothetical protein [Granulicella sp. S190]
MKKSFVVLAFCFCSLAMYGQKARLAQELPHAKSSEKFPITVHFSGVHYRGDSFAIGETADVIYADAVLNGKKVELRGNHEIPFQSVPLGDHQARLVKDPHNMGDSPIFQEYDVVLPDKTVWRCTVTGFSE